jgi:hypothetical protein
MQLLICRPVGWIEGYSVAEDEEDEALEQAVFGLGDGHSETGTLSANPAHSSLDGRVVIEWVHEDDCLVTALTCTAFRDFVRDIHRKRKEMKGSTHSGRITTLYASLVSSLGRFLWVRSSFPAWRKGATVAKSLGWGNVLLHRDAWAAGGAAVGKGARVSVGLSRMLRSSAGRAAGCAAVSESEWMPVGFKHMHGSRGGRAFERATVPASQWMPVECIHMLGGCEGRAHGGPTLTL